MREYSRLLLIVMVMGFGFSLFFLLVGQTGKKFDPVHGAWHLEGFSPQDGECPRVFGLDAGKFEGSLFLTHDTLLIGNSAYNVEHKSFYDDEVKIVIRDDMIILRRTDSGENRKWDEMEWASGEEVQRFVRKTN